MSSRCVFPTERGSSAPRVWAWRAAGAGDTLLLALSAGADANTDFVISDLHVLRLLNCGERTLRTPRA